MQSDDLHAMIARARSHGLGDIPRRSARRQPDKVAVIDGDVVLSFAEFDNLVDRAAAALHDNGFGLGDRIGLLARNCWQYALLAFATARAGVVLVPINFMLTAEEISYILGHSGVSGLVVEADLTRTAEEAMGRGGVVGTRVAWCPPDRPAPGWDDFARWLSTDTLAPGPHIDDDQLVRLMYTSGTESRPKAAMHTSRSLMWQYVSTIVAGEMSHDDVEIHSLPLYHCAQLDNFLATDIYLGATSIILPRPDPETVLRTIERYRVTSYFAPPTVWISLLRSPVFDEVDLSSLRKGYYGASAMPVEILHEMRERLPNLRLWNFYGQTEMAPLASALGPDEQDAHAGSAGRPVVNVETAILDDDNNPVMAGVVGEIAHRSPHLTPGYLDDQERTAEAFRGGWFHSGDLGYYDEHGLLHVVDRKKDMIKTGGENVASREVEEVLYRHTGVQEVAVFGLVHPVWVEAVVAAIVARDGATLTKRTSSPTVGSTWPGSRHPNGLLRRFVAEEPERQAAQTSAAGTLHHRTAHIQLIPNHTSAKGIRHPFTRSHRAIRRPRANLPDVLTTCLSNPVCCKGVPTILILQTLLDERDIVRALARFARIADGKKFDALDEVFAPDVLFDYGSGRLESGLLRFAHYLGDTSSDAVEPNTLSAASPSISTVMLPSAAPTSRRATNAWVNSSARYSTRMVNTSTAGKGAQTDGASCSVLRRGRRTRGRPRSSLATGNWVDFRNREARRVAENRGGRITDECFDHHRPRKGRDHRTTRPHRRCAAECHRVRVRRADR